MKWMKWIALLTILLTLFLRSLSMADPLIIDHNDLDITQVSEAEINRAKSVLHIGYGHTSHGSQLIDGMSGLVGFADNGGLGLTLPTNIFAFNNGGTGGALDLEDGAGYSSGWLESDCGYWPNWYNETIEYLDDPSHADVNVIIWSWCGQMDDKYANGTLSNQYLIPMSSLETSYPDVVFVYMTGHAEIDDDANNKAACEAIRHYCRVNDKVLFDFNDIEHYNPDGDYFSFVHDNCNYYATNGGALLGNWATEWQNSHTQDVDWYNCGAAHSQPLNANMKAYAAWKLWCELGKDLDRDGFPDEWEDRYGDGSLFNSPTNDCDRDGVSDWDEYIADTNPTNSASRLRIHTILNASGCQVSFGCTNSRSYCLEVCTSLSTGAWFQVTGQTNITGEADGNMTLNDQGNSTVCTYRVKVVLDQ